MKRLRQERDPNFKGQKGLAKAKAETAAMPPPPSRIAPKRKKGLGYQVTIPVIRFILFLHASDRCCTEYWLTDTRNPTYSSESQ